MKLKKSRSTINAQALLWRILLLHKKHWICTILTIVLPTLLFGILVLIASFIPHLEGQAKDKIFQHDNLFDEIVKISDTMINPVVLFYPENNLTRDLIDHIDWAIYFLNEESKLGKYCFKSSFWLSQSKKIKKKYLVFLLWWFIHFFKIEEEILAKTGLTFHYLN